MIRLVIRNLTPIRRHRFIFVCRAEHLHQFDLADRLAEWSPGAVVLAVDRITEGAAETVLTAAEAINTDDPLMIANCDQWIDADVNDYLARLDKPDLDGVIMTMTANDPKWSYVALDDAGYVSRVAEKQVISDEATVGIYSFRSGRNFVGAARRMIQDDARTLGEFYVAPVYNYLIAEGRSVGVFNIGHDGAGMHGIGTPDDLGVFLATEACKSATHRVMA